MKKLKLNLSVIMLAAAAQLVCTPRVQAAEGHASGAEPQLQSYAIDFEAKLTTDRRTNGLSDTYRRPGAELTVSAAHESGWIGYLQLGSVARDNFPNGDRWTAVAATGYRWGRADGWHFGVGAAHELFANAQVSAPRNALVDPDDQVKTRFDTTFGLLEFGYGIIEARYLHVLSRDFRGNNTSTVCGSAAQIDQVRGGDFSEAMGCYEQGDRHSRGSQLLQVETRLPIAENLQALIHVGHTRVKGFAFLNTWDYRLGLAHQRWGYQLSAEVVGGVMRNDFYGQTVNEGGDRIRRMDRPALVLSVARKF